MKQLFLGFALLLVSATSLAQSSGTSLWVVSSDDSKVYLGGTVHLLRASDYPLPAQYDRAYADADRLYFETDIGEMSALSTQARMMQQLMYQDQRTLQSVLNAEAYQALADYMQTSGLPLAMVQKFKPGLLISTLTVLEMQKMGFTPIGVDSHFHSRAVTDGKPVGQLESVDDQIGFLAAMGEGKESEFIMVSLQDLAKVDLLEQMIAAWRQGDEETLETMFVTDMKTLSPELYQQLLVQRNRNWLPLIEEMFTSGETELVLVGAAHLVGDEGLIALLAERGYTVSRL
jgi:uncharacterized protein